MTHTKDKNKIVSKAGILASAFLASAFTASAEPPAAPVNFRQQCVPVEVSVYFQPGVSELNALSEKVITQAMAQTSTCEIARIEVVGFADASGAADINQSLSEARAQGVYEFLAGHGVEANIFSVDARGEEGAIDANGHPVVMNRTAHLRITPVREAV